VPDDLLSARRAGVWNRFVAGLRFRFEEFLGAACVRDPLAINIARVRPCLWGGLWGGHDVFRRVGLGQSIGTGFAEFGKLSFLGRPVGAYGGTATGPRQRGAYVGVWL
jgi:hypothetical protein